MAKKRDFLDELIDIRSDLQSMSNPLADVTDALAGEPGQVKVWNPAEYKERPRANVIPCISCQTKKFDLCTKCVDACPVQALDLSEGYIDIADTCRKCGLCSSACPTDCFITSNITARRLYDRISRAAMAYEHAYVTCTRALGHMPADNEVVLPCVGAMPAEVWVALLEDFGNVSVYLPLGICDRCRTTTGESAYMDAIGAAEELTGRALGLEVSERDLDHSKNHEFERKEFLNDVMRSAGNAFSRVNPAVAAARAVTRRLDENTRRINHLQQTLEQACGERTVTKRKRVLTQRRQLMLTTMQKHPKLAERIEVKRPVCDTPRCTACGACSDACPTHALELTDDGVVRIEPSYCIECDACLAVCKEHALAYEAYDASELIVPEKSAEDLEEEKRKEAERKAELERLKKKGREQLKRGLDLLEKLDS